MPHGIVATPNAAAMMMALVSRLWFLEESRIGAATHPTTAHTNPQATKKLQKQLVKIFYLLRRKVINPVNTF